MDSAEGWGRCVTVAKLRFDQDCDLADKKFGEQMCKMVRDRVIAVVGAEGEMLDPKRITCNVACADGTVLGGNDNNKVAFDECAGSQRRSLQVDDGTQDMMVVRFFINEVTQQAIDDKKTSNTLVLTTKTTLQELQIQEDDGKFDTVFNINGNSYNVDAYRGLNKEWKEPAKQQSNYCHFCQGHKSLLEAAFMEELGISNYRFAALIDSSDALNPLVTMEIMEKP